MRLPRLLAVLMLAAAGALPAAAAELKPFADTSRLVTIGGSLTEIVFALGENDRLVARDQTAVFPEAALKLPDVGYMRALAPEGVLSVRPTALLVLEGSGPPEALDVLNGAGVEYQTVPESFTHTGILRKVEAVGEALGVQNKAEALMAQIDADLSAVEAMTKRIGNKKRVLFILSMQGNKIQAAGTGTAADGIIALGGGINSITDYAGYKALTEEAIIAAAPDVILMMDRGGDHAASNADLFGNPAIALTPAGRDHKVIRIDGAYLLGFGPRTASAARDLAHAMYADQVPAH